jgi:hypothetical protein
MTGIDWDQHLVGSRPGEPGFDPNKGFNQILYPGGQLPPGWQPNTGGMNPNGPQPVPGVQPVPFDPNSPFGKDLFDPGWGIEKGPQGNRGSGQPINQPMSGLPFQSMATGSLQSLGGGQLNASGMVNLRGTDGTTKAVPQQDLAHWLSKGAVRV